MRTYAITLLGVATCVALMNCTPGASQDSGLVDAGDGPDDAGSLDIDDAGSDFSEETQVCIDELDDLYMSAVPVATNCEERDLLTCEQYVEATSFWFQMSQACDSDSDCTKMDSRVACGDSSQVFSGGCKMPVAFATACAAVQKRAQYLDFLCNDCGPPAECTGVAVCVDGPPVCRSGFCKISAF